MDSIVHYLMPTITNISRYFLVAGTAFLIFYVWFPKFFSKNKIQAKFAQHKDFIREILHSMQASVVFGMVIALFVFTPLKDYTQIYTDINEFAIWWIPVSVILALIIHDTYFYWMHRTLHHPRLFKTFHLVHHKSVNPSPWASYSFHLFESITESLIFPIIVLLMPMHPLALASFGLASFIINVYGHLGFEIMPKWFRYTPLFEIINTSVHHNLHHEKFKGNYGLYFRDWDRIMKTESPNYVAEYDALQEKRFGENAVPAFAKKLKLAKQKV